MNPGKPPPRIQRRVCLCAAFSLLLFQILAAPHRVHHFFEHYPAPQFPIFSGVEVHVLGDNHHQDQPARPSPPTDQTDCVVLIAAQNTHALAPASFDPPILVTAVPCKLDPGTHSIIAFNASPWSQRAPPRI